MDAIDPKIIAELQAEGRLTVAELAQPGVHRLTSTIVMKRVVDNRPLPVSRPAATRRR